MLPFLSLFHVAVHQAEGGTFLALSDPRIEALATHIQINLFHLTLALC